MIGERPGSDSVLTTIGSISGVASLVLAVAGNNLDKLTGLQRWGLAGASAVMLWAFLANLIIQQFINHRDRGAYAKAGATMFVGGLVGAGLLLAIFPFFSFGLAETSRDMLSMWVAGSFACVFTLLSIGVIFGP